VKPTGVKNVDEQPQPLDERKAAVLRAIVEEYVASAQPVGSATIVARRALGVSAATVRNEMGVLEREGYIAQPHTSAGRVPTDKGYRFFVDHFAGAAALAPNQRREVADFFAASTRVIDDLLHETSQFLARITRHTAVVVGPQHDVTSIRAVQLVLIDPRTVIVVAVLSDGVVEREVVRFDADLDAVDVEEAGRRLTDHLLGTDRAMVSAPQPVRPDLDEPSDRIARAAADALRKHAADSGEPLFVGGASRLATEGFESAEVLPDLLELLEQQVVVVSLLRELLGPGLTVTIGGENPRHDLKECSLVLAPYLVDGTPVGTVGVLGPTRMDYRQAQAAVATISAQLSRRLAR
jgi:heat-inducible transcriptional repressor